MRLKPATRLIQFDGAPGDPNAPVATPIYQTATFEQPGATRCGDYDYTRSGNPTRAVLERTLADLDEAQAAFAFASGMAALTAVTRLAPAGSRIVAGDDLYGGTFRLLSRLAAERGVDVCHVDARDPATVAACVTEDTALVLIESPTNPLLHVCDIRAVAEIARRNEALLAVDNSVMSPYLQRPLELGADISVQSATKALGGHSDLIAGVVATNDSRVAERIGWVQNAEGTGLAPFESWLLLRSLKTLAARLDRQQEATRAIAEFLSGCPAVLRVRYPGLDNHPGNRLHHRQAGGAGTVISFETRSEELSARVVESTRLFKIAVSFGSVGSVISLPRCLSHASVPAERKRKHPLPPGLVRLSVGLEDPLDLIADLARAFELALREEAGAEFETATRRRLQRA